SERPTLASMVIKNFSSRSAQACSSRAFMPPESTLRGLESQHKLNVVALGQMPAIGLPAATAGDTIFVTATREKNQCSHKN
ncbi:MAG TPA: hypothetical protein VFZ27_19240, partial [Terriglobia bacterium]|nr:hypothetical protein [Terriglobia bacterium]